MTKLTVPQLKRLKERADAGAYDAELTAFIEKQYKLMLRRQKARYKKVAHKTRVTKLIRKRTFTGPASPSPSLVRRVLTESVSLYDLLKELQKAKRKAKARIDKDRENRGLPPLVQVNATQKRETEADKAIRAIAEITNRPPAPRKKRKSPRQPFSGWRTAP